MMNKFFHYLLLIPLIALFCLTPVQPTLADGQAPTVQGIYVEGYEDESYNSSNFTAFSGSKVLFVVESTTTLTTTNCDGATINTVSVDGSTYCVSVESNVALKTQVIFSNSYGYSFKNITFIDNDITKINIKAPTMIAKSQTNNFNLVFNDNAQLKNANDVTYKLKFPSGDEITLDADSNYVNSISKNAIALDFSTLTDISGTFKLSASIGGVRGQIDFQIVDASLSSSFVLMADNISYLTDATELTIDAKIDADSYAKFDVLDRFIRLKNAELISKDKDFAEYMLTLDISNVTESYSVLISCPTTSGNTVRGVYINSISNVTDFKITSEKTTYSPNETIVVTAIINGNASLSANIDWYVNGVLVETGSQFSFSRKEGGAFNISAKLGEIESNALSLSISYAGSELVVWYIVFIVALLLLIGLIVFRKKKKNFFMSAYLADRARKIVPRFNTQFNNYKKHQFRDLLYDTANLREDTYQNYQETKSLDFERAMRELSNVIKAMREIYKAPKANRQELFIKYTSTVENSMAHAITAYEHFNALHPNEKFFDFKNFKKNKKEKGVNPNVDNDLKNAKRNEGDGIIAKETPDIDATASNQTLAGETQQGYVDLYNLDAPKSEVVEIVNQPSTESETTALQPTANTEVYNLDTPQSESIELSEIVDIQDTPSDDASDNFAENNSKQDDNSDTPKNNQNNSTSDNK